MTSLVTKVAGLVQQSINWLEQIKDAEQPFMLYLTTGLVYPAFRVQQKYLDMITESEIEIPPLHQEHHPAIDYINATKGANFACPEGLIRQIRQVYYAMIATLDDMLGQLFDAVDRMGLKDSTYIIFSSDHGEMAMEHGQVLKRSALY